MHGGNQFVFVFVENGTPIFFRFEIDEVFGIEEAGSIGAVIGASDLAGALRNFGKRAQDDARLVHDADAFVGPGAGRKRAANPDCAFIEMRQKFGADAPLNARKFPSRIATAADADGDVAVTNGRAHGSAIAFGEPTTSPGCAILFAPLAKAKLAITGAMSMEKSSAPSSANATVQAIG